MGSTLTLLALGMESGGPAEACSGPQKPVDGCPQLLDKIIDALGNLKHKRYGQLRRPLDRKVYLGSTHHSGTMSARRKSSALDRNRIAREDVLRFLLEEGGSAGIDEVRAELSSSEVADEAIADLRGSGLLIVNGDRISLTDKGRLRALEVYRRHISIEGVLGKLLAGEKVHEATHYLEHIEDLRGEALKYLLSRGVVLRLSEMEKGFEARVLVVLETKPELVARLYGVGVLPGRKIRVLARGGGVYLVEVGSEGRVVALDADLAPKIMIIART